MLGRNKSLKNKIVKSVIIRHLKRHTIRYAAIAAILGLTMSGTIPWVIQASAERANGWFTGTRETLQKQVPLKVRQADIKCGPTKTAVLEFKGVQDEHPTIYCIPAIIKVKL